MSEPETGFIVNEYVIPSDRKEMEFYIRDGAEPVGVGWKSNNVPVSGIAGIPHGWYTVLFLEQIGMPKSKKRLFVVKTGERFLNPGLMRYAGCIEEGRAHVFQEITR